MDGSSIVKCQTLWAHCMQWTEQFVEQFVANLEYSVFGTALSRTAGKQSLEISGKAYTSMFVTDDGVFAPINNSLSMCVCIYILILWCINTTISSVCFF